MFGDGAKVVLVMVGLPARGKSYIANKLQRYMQWLAKNCKSFNVGDIRRARLGPSHDYHFFESDNHEAVKLRESFALEALENLCRFLKDEDGDVAIFDATNTTRARRDFIVRNLNERMQGTTIEIIFVESLCTDQSVIQTNLERKLDNADYHGMPREAALADFKARLTAYEKIYEPLNEPNLSYIKIYNVTGKLEAQNIHGYLPSQLVFFLLNLHLCEREIYITRHGQSIFNLYDRLGGDSDLCPAGKEYAKNLGVWLRDNHPSNRPLTIWCSTLTRAISTAQIVKDEIELKVDGPKVIVQQFHMLNEINAGICEGMTYEEVKQKMPDVAIARSRDKLRFRYPGGGESYLDLVDRLQPLIIELERMSTDVLVIAHQAVVRVLLSYFQDTRPDDCPHVEVPLHQFIRLSKIKTMPASDRWTYLGPKEMHLQNATDLSGSGIYNSM